MTDRFEEVYGLLADQILSRYRRSRNRTMLDVYRIDPLFLDVDREFLEFVLSHRAEVSAVLADPGKRESLVCLFVDETLRYSYENNQFVHFDEKERQVFLAIYRGYVEAIRDVIAASPDLDGLRNALSEVIAAHFRRLRANISRFFDPGTADNLRDNLVFQKAVCSEYSPEFQLKLMGIDPSGLPEPALDIGCGQSGRLVKYLASIGLDARGADRLVDEHPLLAACDWFDFPFLPESWGAVISHMAFSNHFLFHHRYRNGLPERYARLYLQILGSLKPGGVFIYSPGLPFIERFLPPEKYRVRRRRCQASSAAGLRAARAAQEDFLYTTRVERKK